MRAIVVTFLLLIFSLPIRAQELTLGATDWCPYSCTDPFAPGIVNEYLSWLLEKRGIQLKVVVIPWSRAIAAANKRQLDGLLTLVKGEAPNLLMTTTPTMGHQNCFFTRADSTWIFNSLSDLRNMHLGTIMNYGYGEEFDLYIDQLPAPQVAKLSGNNPEKRLFHMLDNRRIDAYISDRYVTMWQRKDDFQNHPTHRVAGCLSETPFYMGFNKDTPNINEIVTWLNAELIKSENIAYRLKIERRYQ